MKDNHGRFVKGTSGNPNGRPKGGKNELSEALLADIVTHWKENGMDAIERTHKEQPAIYLKIVASLIPKDIEYSEKVSTRELTENEIRCYNRILEDEYRPG